MEDHVARERPTPDRIVEHSRPTHELPDVRGSGIRGYFSADLYRWAEGEGSGVARSLDVETNRIGQAHGLGRDAKPRSLHHLVDCLADVRIAVTVLLTVLAAADPRLGMRVSSAA